MSKHNLERFPVIESALKDRTYLGTTNPTVQNKINLGKLQTEDTKISTRSLWIFDGPSLGKCNITTDIRNEVVYKNLGKLRLRDVNTFDVGIPLLSALLNITGGNIIHELRIFWDKFLERREGVKALSKYRANLVLRKSDVPENEDIQEGFVVGKIDFVAKELSHIRCSRSKLERTFGGKVDFDTLGGLPALLMTQRIHIPEELIDWIKSLSLKGTKKYQDPALVLRENFDPTRLNPNTRQHKQKITIATHVNVNGETSLSATTIDFEKPKYKTLITGDPCSCKQRKLDFL